MAENVQSLVSTGATLAVGTGVVFDSVTIGASTGNVEYVKLMSGSSGSTTTVPASSGNALGAVGLQVNVVNSTSFPIGVNLTGGQSSVSVTGNVTTIFSTASTASVIIANTTAAAGIVQLAYNSSLVSTSTPLPVLLQNSTATVTIQGNASASLTTGGMGGSTATAVQYVVTKPYALAAAWETISTVATSTAVCVLFSSAASTRHNLTSLVITNAGTAESVIRIFDGAATTAGLLFRTDLSSAGGGIAISLPVPIRGTSGAACVAKTVPASTVYINVTGFKST